MMLPFLLSFFLFWLIRCDGSDPCVLKTFCMDHFFVLGVIFKFSLFITIKPCYQDSGTVVALNL